LIWFLYAVFSLLLTQTPQAAQPLQPPPEPESDECVPKESLKIGLTNQGGYAFNYQSRKGDGCRLYRVRNTPGHLLTPVIWEDEHEIFFSPDLPECPATVKDCGEWVETTLTDTKPPIKGETSLGYGGPNRDEYKDKPDAFRKDVSKLPAFPPLFTRIRGVLADKEHRPLQLDISVRSVVSGNAPEYRLSYVIKVTGDFDFQIMKPNSFPPSGRLGILWSAAASPEFLEALPKAKWTKEPKEGKYTRVVTVEDIPAKSVSLVDDKKEVLALLEGDTRLTSTTAPAYRPAK
jgi:hypothetical protein